MRTSFHLTILSSEKKIFDGELLSMIAPGELGYLGILANHAPLMSTLVPGIITLKDLSGTVTRFEAIGGGFLEISDNKATILLNQEAIA